MIEQTRVSWTDGVDRPFGEDFLNFWSAAWLAVVGRWQSIYDIAAFHDFQVGVVGNAIDLYHYSYPPTLLVLTAPFSTLPYPVAWVAWQTLGWLAFATAIRRAIPRYWLLLALAWPAVFINAIGGQAGCWIAAIVAWGLILLPTRPLLAGLLLSLLSVKPQLAWLVPLALLAGREWRALFAMVGGSIALAAIATLAFGPAIWASYAEQADLLRRVILEDGTGVWHRMISIFVLVRHVGAPVGVAYAAQAIVSLVAAAFVTLAWYRRSPARDHCLIVGMLVGSIYVSDYDCVILALPAIYLSSLGKAGRIAAALLAALPLVAAALAVSTQIALGAFLLWPAVAVLRASGNSSD